MNLSIPFLRIFYVVLCLFLSSSYSLANSAEFSTGLLVNGLFFGLVFSGLMIGVDMLLRKVSLRSFNIVVIGLFFGYLLSQGILATYSSVLELAGAEPSSAVQVAVILISTFLGLNITLRSAEQLSLSIPFLQLKGSKNKQSKTYLIAPSLLGDPRILDISTSGLLDNMLVLPRFVIAELEMQTESSDESIKAKGRRCLENLKKLEASTTLNITYDDTDYPDIKAYSLKLGKLSKRYQAPILSSDVSSMQPSPGEDVRVINIQSLSNALKPLTPAGETMNIKVQRYGKEARQGVGYLEDGTMVVINGGGEHIGQSITVHVLSVKHTSSGRIIFCNASEGGEDTVQDMAEKHSTPGYVSV